MYGTRSAQIFIDEFPLATVEPLEGGCIEPLSEIGERTLRIGGEMSFTAKTSRSDIENLFKLCFGKEPYRNLGKCRKCALANDCVKAKINQNFNKRN